MKSNDNKFRSINDITRKLNQSLFFTKWDLNVKQANEEVIAEQLDEPQLLANRNNIHERVYLDSIRTCSSKLFESLKPGSKQWIFAYEDN